MNNKPDTANENPKDGTDNPSYLSYVMRARLKIRDRYKQVKSYYSKKNVIAGVIGNVLEWYDFAVFGYFAPIIGAHFFPSDNPITSLLSAFGVFAIGYFARPIGGIIFGRMGDKSGRKIALQVSVMLMAIPTFLISVLPTYAQIGILAPLLLIILRLLQGISVGGELIGSICFTTETAPANERGFWGSWTQGSLIGGILLGSLVAAIIQGLLPTESLMSWGWRIPFLAGLGIGIFGLWMRTGLSEPSDFANIKETADINRNPIMDVINKFPLRIFHAAMLVILSGGGFYLLFVWWPTFLEDVISPPVKYAFATNVISMFVLMSIIPLTGWLSDKCGRKPLLIIGSLSIIIAAYPLFVLAGHATFISVLAAQLIFAVLLSIFIGPIPATLAEMFPSHVRYSGIALGYNISLSLFGGTAPLIATWLIFRFNSITIVAYYLMIMAFVSLIASLTLNKENSSEMDAANKDQKETELFQ
jgi:MHS family proline/betaine transporter-like MFS transporter